VSSAAFDPATKCWAVPGLERALELNKQRAEQAEASEAS